MKNNIEKLKNSVFENIKKINQIGQEYWSARELFVALEYKKWDKFLNVIDKAKEACKNSGQEVENHFPRVEKMVRIGSGAERDIGDLFLSRYACYLIIQNADPKKEKEISVLYEKNIAPTMPRASTLGIFSLHLVTNKQFDTPNII